MKNLILCIIFMHTLSLSAQVIVTCAGNGSTGFGGDGHPAVSAELDQPYAINLDDSGNLYICDVVNERIRKVTNPAILGVGIITTIAGNGTTGYSGDNRLGIYAQIHNPADVTIDHHGNVYIADQSNNCIRKVTPADTITTIAGTGVAGYNGDGISATTAQLNNPTGVAVDTLGNVYIADAQNYRIRKVDTSGIITTIAGTGIAGFSPDGSLADTAKMSPYAVRIGSTGAIYFADSIRIRKINSGGIIATVAGNGIHGYSGDSGLAINAEIGGGAIAIDSFGNLFIADADAERIRKVDTTGIITTVAGNGIPGFYGDNGHPLMAELDLPQGVAVNNSGDIYIGDVGNSRVRLVTTHPERVNNVIGNVQGIYVYPNPCTDICTVQVSDLVNEQADVVISNIMGVVQYKFNIITNRPYTIQPNLTTGIYIISTTITQEHFTEKIIIQ